LASAPERLEERRPVTGGFALKPDLIEDLQRALLSPCGGNVRVGVEAEGSAQRAEQVVPQARPVPWIAESVRQLDVVDELVAVDPRQVLEANAGLVEHRAPLENGRQDPGLPLGAPAREAAACGKPERHGVLASLFPQQQAA
jgi:hypothetical protein